MRRRPHILLIWHDEEKKRGQCSQGSVRLLFLIFDIGCTTRYSRTVLHRAKLETPVRCEIKNLDLKSLYGHYKFILEFGRLRDWSLCRIPKLFYSLFICQSRMFYNLNLLNFNVSSERFGSSLVLKSILQNPNYITLLLHHNFVNGYSAYGLFSPVIIMYQYGGQTKSSYALK